MFDGVEHVAIASPQPAVLAQWYVENLAFRQIYEYAGNYFVKARNGAILEIIPAEGEGAERKMYDPGLRHMAIAVKDFDAAFASLQQRGIHFLGEPVSFCSSESSEH
jgi:glyoxylase I family protein